MFVSHGSKSFLFRQVVSLSFAGGNVCRYFAASPVIAVGSVGGDRMACLACELALVMPSDQSCLLLT
jgi:hypothetical protein